MGGFLSSSIARKVAMALSALFLIIFLIIHLAVNLTSLFSEHLFNELSHFMGTNPMVQFAMQPILIFGVVFHFVMGFVLELKNRRSRTVKYAQYKGAAGASWMSRNMLLTGGVVLAFLVVHFVDFWIPEMAYKYVDFLPEDPTRYFEELQHKFASPVKVGFYVLSFVLLSLHLLHGFQSAFQSVGFHNKYTPVVKTIGKVYAIAIPLGFIIIALYHHFNH
ncbi:MAG: succinate dehydrogenase cytochrome b subunit [Lutibacter sp.]|nr:succinate dehydrogenase cytochrome b subunit [Lutibacter sp.]